MSAPPLAGFRLAPQQARCWSEQQRAGEGLFRARAVIEIRGPLDHQRLAAATAALVARHEVLRTGYQLLPGTTEPLQVVWPEMAPAWAEPGAAPPAADPATLLAVAALPALNLERGPFFALGALAHGEERHSLLLELPALNADVATLALLTADLAALYGASGAAPPAPELLYVDLAEWLHQLLAADELADGSRFWRDQVAPTPARLGKESAAPRPFEPALLPVRRAEGAGLGASAEELAIAAWSTLLGRLEEQTRLVLGVALPGRTHEELAATAGLFARLLPFTAELEADPTFTAFLGAVKGRLAAMRAFQDFADVTAGVELPFQVRATAAAPAFTAGGARFCLVHGDATQERFALRLEVTAEALPGSETGFCWRIAYDRARFGRDEAERLAERFAALLGAALARPETRLSHLPLLGASERRLLLSAWNEHPPSPQPRLLLEALAETAALAPAAVAVTASGEALTYSALVAASDRLGGLLARRGVGPEVRVAVCLSHGRHLVPTLLGVLRAGGAYVPLDPALPAARLAFQLEDSGAALLLTEARWSAALPAGSPPRLLVEELAAAGAACPPPPPSPACLAYVLYTSGSTGRPKGVMVDHRGLAHYLAWCREAYPLTAGRGSLVHSPVAFDLTVTSLFAPLLAGSTVHLLPEDAGVEGLAAALLAPGGFSFIKLTPSHLDALAALLPPERLSGTTGALILGGEALHAESLVPWRREAEAVRLINEYGPTEAVVGCAVYEVEGTTPAQGPVAIGRPIHRARLYLLDARFEPVPMGVSGELCVGGEALARGYLARPALTAARFLPEPWSGEAGARLYRTGDRARLGPGAELEFLGRLDDQIKIRGFRVELGEIEAVLLEHPALRAAAVALHEEAQGRQQLVAYVVPRHAATPAEDELLAHLRRRLPEFMAPTAFVHLNALPLSPNGKVDRRALPPPTARRGPERTYVPPATATERQLAAIWSRLLGVERVGREDGFFALGGDSILGLQATVAAREVGLGQSARQLFQFPTLAALAAALDAAPTAAAAQPEAAAPDAGTALPLTPIQHWFFAQRWPAPHHFNQALLLCVPPGFAPAAWRRAAAAVAAAHPALSLRFHQPAPEGPFAARQGAAEDPLPVATVSLAALPAPARGAAITTLAGRAQRSLDLTSGPLWRGLHLAAGPGQEGRLLLVVHHLAVDGVSWRILLEDFATAYTAAAGGAPLHLAAEPISAVRFARALADLAHSPALAAELPFWRAMGPEPGAEPLLPYDAAGADGGAEAQNRWASEERLERTLSAFDTTTLLRAAGLAHHLRPDELLLAALGLAVRRATGREVVHITLEGHGRWEISPGLDPSRTVGWLTALYPLRLSLAGAATPAAILQATREQSRAVPGGGVGYGVLRYLSEPAAGGEGLSLAAQPEPEISLNYHGQLDRGLALGFPFTAAPEAAGPRQDPRGRRPHALEIGGAVAGGRLVLSFGYSRDLHRRETIAAFAEGFVTALAELLATCRAGGEERLAASDVPLAGLAEEELDALLGDGVPPEDLYPLSPSQQGILFETRREGGDLYFDQLSASLEGPLDAPALRAAWQRALDRHAALRTAFIWDRSGRPLQRVERRLVLPFRELDLRALPDAAQEGVVASFLAADRARGFELTRPPLLRLALLRLGEERHRFVWSSHHLLLDGWSSAIVLGEVFSEYHARRRGERASLPARRPFRDYIAWLGEQDLDTARRLWAARLAPFDAPTTPAQIEPVKRPGEAGVGVISGALEPRASGALREFARRHGFTVASVLTATWGLLLSRSGGGRRVLFGTVAAGRPDELEGSTEIVGMTIQVLPTAIAVDERSPLFTFLKRVQDEGAEDRQHGHLPLVELRALTAIAREEPLLQTLLSFQNYLADAGRSLSAASADLRITGVELFERTNYPLTVIIGASEPLSVRLLFDRARVEGEAAARLHRHFLTLLTAVSAVGDAAAACLVDLDWQTAAEREELTGTLARGPAARWTAPSIDGRVRAIAVRGPDRIALDDGSEQWSYGALTARAGVLAAQLVAAGAGPEARIGLAAERSPAMVAGLLAILSAGGAYVPLDPEYPMARLLGMAEDAGIDLLLADAAGSAAFLRQRFTLVSLEPGPERGEEPLVVTGTLPEQLAYVVFTSGSTGRPKGVGVPHGAVLRLVGGEDFCRFHGEHIFLLAAPVSFDASTFEIWGALCHGARLVLLPPGPPSLAGLAAVLRAHRVTTTFLSSGLFNELVDAEPDSLAAMTDLLVGGEALSVPHCEAMLHGAGPARLLNGYGPTENTTFTTCFPLPRGARFGAAVPIGRPITATTVFVLDRWGRPLPVGVPGELLTGGDGLARGYLGRPAATAERFVPDASSGVASARLYRTGDRVRFRADGNLDFLGRFDQQVKIRGFRVEPGEVERALLTHPAIRQAAVVAEQHADALRLVAYVVPRADAPAAAELRLHLLGELLAAMVPAVFVPLPSLPLTAAGKVDRAALPPAEVTAEAAAPAGDGAPQDPLGELISGLFAELLQRPAVHPGDNFFDLGGHSLLAARAIARLSELLGAEVPLAALFEAPTLAEFTRAVAAVLGAGPATAIEPIPRDGDLPASFGQLRLWLEDRLRPGSALYNTSSLLEIEGPLRPEILARSLAELVRRHEILRTTFGEGADGPLQLIHPPVPPHLPLVDVLALSPADGRRAAFAILRRALARPFDLAAGPLLRVLLIRLGKNHHLSGFVLHHITTDGWSMGILVRELSVLYAELGGGRPSPLPPLPLQYADFAAWQRRHLAGEVLEEHLAYWRRQLAGDPAPPRLPAAGSGPGGERGARLRRELPPTLLPALAELGRRRGTTLFMTLLGAFAAWLFRLTGQEDLLLGSAFSGRSRRETEGLIGFFVNLLPLRLDLAGDPRFSDLLARVRTTTLGALIHQELPFERIVELARAERGEGPQINLAFGLDNTPREALQPSDLTLRAVPLEDEAARFPLTVWLSEAAGRLSAVWTYDTDLFDEATIARFAGDYEGVLARVVAQPEIRLEALPQFGPSGEAGRAGAPPSALKTAGLRTTRRRALPPTSAAESKETASS